MAARTNTCACLEDSPLDLSLRLRRPLCSTMLMTLARDDQLDPRRGRHRARVGPPLPRETAYFVSLTHSRASRWPQHRGKEPSSSSRARRVVRSRTPDARWSRRPGLSSTQRNPGIHLARFVFGQTALSRRAVARPHPPGQSDISVTAEGAEGVARGDLERVHDAAVRGPSVMLALRVKNGPGATSQHVSCSRSISRSNHDRVFLATVSRPAPGTATVVASLSTFGTDPRPPLRSAREARQIFCPQSSAVSWRTTRVIADRRPRGRTRHALRCSRIFR